MILALMFFAVASNTPIEVGKFDPSAFPQAIKVDRRIPQEELTARADRILASGQCLVPGQDKGKYSITIPYAVLIQPSGGVTKIVVKEIGCADLELLTGQVARELAKARDFRPTRVATDQWYVSEVYYAHGGEDLARTAQDDNKIICEDSRPVTGSRLARERDCRTAAEWRVYRLDRDRMKRDMLSDGANLDMGRH